jgi:hypothetical protein
MQKSTTGESIEGVEGTGKGASIRSSPLEEPVNGPVPTQAARAEDPALTRSLPANMALVEPFGEEGAKSSLEVRRIDSTSKSGTPLVALEALRTVSQFMGVGRWRLQVVEFVVLRKPASTAFVTLNCGTSLQKTRGQQARLGLLALLAFASQSWQVVACACSFLSVALSPIRSAASTRYGQSRMGPSAVTSGVF